MAKILLTDFMPKPSELDPTRVVETRQALELYLKSFWPELDTRPNSVFGDVMLTPASVLMTALEVAHERRESDLNLVNLAGGTVYNEDFARQFLASLGATPRGSVQTTGVIRLLFDVNKTYVIDPDARITFGGVDYKFGSDEGDPIVVQPVGTENARRVLTRTGADQFIVYFPVFGEPGGTVSDGTTAITNIPHPELVSVVAVGDFDAGLLEESVPVLAQKARKTFYSASLTSRGGAINFVTQQFPSLLGASAVITGDTEMLRDATNPMGVREGKLDLYVKSRQSYLFGEQILTLTYDEERLGWVGKLTLPQPPAFYDLARGIFQVTNFDNARSVNTVFASSGDPLVDNVGISYSNREVLGILVDDPNPTNQQNHTIGPVTNASQNAAGLVVEGIYASNIFSNVTARSISLTFQQVEIVDDPDLGPVTTAVALAVDSNTLENTKVHFYPDNTGSPTLGISRNNFAFDKLFRGLTLKVNSDTGAFVAADLLGTKFEFTFKGRTAEFSVNFLHDPALVSVDAIVSDADHRPAGVDVLTRNFLACHISEFVVNYRVPFGTTVDLDTAKQQIFQYVNSIVFPNVFEDSVIGSIMLSVGASGVQSIIKKGTFYPSLASIFIQKDGTEIVIPRETNSTLTPSTNNFGVGARNINYILDLDTITFNGTVF